MKTIQIAVRMPEGLLRRVDEHRDALRESHPGYQISRADTVRALLVRGLATVGGSKEPGGMSDAGAGR